jgi:hypothetical protein
VALRPEALRFADDTGAAGNKLTGIVERRRFLGATVHYTVAAADGLSLIVARPASEPAVETGARVSLAFDPDQAVVLAGRAKPAP